MYSVDKSKIENAIRDILEAIGEDPNREGLLDTPSRVAKMYEEIFSGIHKDPREHLKILFKSEEHEEL
ncbi:MAG: GTP cyclohydrolase I, partial [Peptostreptococcaceae bacterium]|nr:GTP cyclohydrolase I [Peptostreptococcaceae bacterium]